MSDRFGIAKSVHLMEKYKQPVKNVKSINALTWAYAKQQGGHREKPLEPLAIAPMRGIMAKPSDEGAHPRGARPGRRAAGAARRGAVRADFFQKGA